MGELSGEDNNLFGLGGALWFAPGERGSDIMSGGAVAFGKTEATGAERGLSGGREGERGNMSILLERLEAFR